VLKSEGCKSPVSVRHTSPYIAEPMVVTPPPTLVNISLLSSRVVSPCPQGVAGSSLMGLLQLVVRFLTSIKNTLTGFFSGGDQTSSTSSSGGRQCQRRYNNKIPYSLDHTLLPISHHSRIVAAPPDMLNEIAAALEY